MLAHKLKQRAKERGEEIEVPSYYLRRTSSLVLPVCAARATHQSILDQHKRWEGAPTGSVAGDSEKREVMLSYVTRGNALIWQSWFSTILAAYQRNAINAADARLGTLSNYLSQFIGKLSPGSFHGVHADYTHWPQIAVHYSREQDGACHVVPCNPGRLRNETSQKDKAAFRWQRPFKRVLDYHMKAKYSISRTIFSFELIDLISVV